MPENINRYQPKIIKFAHNLSYRNGLNAQFQILTIKSISDLENFNYIYKNYTY